MISQRGGIKIDHIEEEKIKEEIGLRYSNSCSTCIHGDLLSDGDCDCDKYNLSNRESDVCTKDFELCHKDVIQLDMIPIYKREDMDKCRDKDIFFLGININKLRVQMKKFTDEEGKTPEKILLNVPKGYIFGVPIDCVLKEVNYEKYVKVE